MEADGLRIAWALLHCSMGDVVIALAMFTLAGIVLWRANWPASRPWARGVVAAIGAIVITACSERYNVYRTGAWSYTSYMPTLYGVRLPAPPWR